MNYLKPIFSTGLICASTLLGAQEYTSSHYSVKLFDQYLKDSGLNRLTLDGKTIVNRNTLFCWYKNGEKNERLSERLTPEYQFADNILTSTKKLVGPDNREFAEISRKIQFKPDSIQVNITAKALTDWTLPTNWLSYREILSLPVDSMIGTTVEATRKLDGVTSTGVVPKIFDPKLWSLKSGGSSRLKIIFPQYVITVTCSEQATVAFNHYGGNQIELTISPEIKSYELNMKAGTEKQWSYTLSIEKLQ